MKQGKTDEAIENYEQAIKVNPNFFKAHNNLGFLFKKLKKYDEAIDHYQQALDIEVDPNDEIADKDNAFPH